MLALLPAWPLLLGVGLLITAFLLYCVLRFGEERTRPWVPPPHHSNRGADSGCAWCHDCNVACWSNEECFCCRETR